MAAQVAGFSAIALHPQAHPAQIAQPHAVSPAQGFHDQGLQLLAAAQSPLHAQGQGVLLVGWGGRIPHLPQGGQDALSPQGIAHIADGEPKTVELVGIQPEAIGQFAAAKEGDLAHAIEALQRFAHLALQPAADEGGAVAAAVVAEAQHHQQVIAAAPHPQPLAAHRLGQLAAHQCRFVLHIDLIELTAAAAEAQAHTGAIACAVGAQAFQSLQAIELPLQQIGDPLLHHLRTGTGVAGAHTHPDRCDIRQVFHLKTREAQQSCQQDQQADHQRQQGALEKRVGDRHGAGGAAAELSRSCQVSSHLHEKAPAEAGA